MGETVALPYDFNTALELWMVFRDHGLLPHAGGYLEQPRAWRRVIRFFTSRYAPIHAAHMTEERERAGKPKRDGEYGDEPVAQGWDGLNGG